MAASGPATVCASERPEPKKKGLACGRGIPWLGQYFARDFSVNFIQNNYPAATQAKKLHLRYRIEIDDPTTMTQFTSALQDPRFALRLTGRLRPGSRGSTRSSGLRLAVGRTRALGKTPSLTAHLPGQPPAVATAAPTATSGNPAAPPRLRGTSKCDETGRLTLCWQLIDPPGETPPERRETISSGSGSPFLLCRETGRRWICRRL